MNMRFIPLMLFVLCNTFACANQFQPGVAINAIELRAADGIRACQKEYLKRARKYRFLPDADRAYVRVFQDQMDVLFTSGAVGVYEERSEQYRSYLFCTTLGNGDPKVVLLLPTQEDALLYDYDVPEIVDLGDEKGPVTDLIFLRLKGRFHFWKKFHFDTIGEYRQYVSEKLNK